MKRLYEKSRLGFALVWIGIYVVSLSLADGISAAIGLEKIITAPLCIALVLVLRRWLAVGSRREYYGLCAFRGSARPYLYFLPLALICSTNLWFGLRTGVQLIPAALYVLSMICVGFLEEVIFRGFLYRALEENGVRSAIWIAGVSFGLGHIVNLLNGADFLPTLLQLVYAAAVGVLFIVIFYKCGSLLPCIIAHAVVNSLSFFAADRPAEAEVPAALALAVLSALYALWIWKKCPKQE